MSFKKYAWAQNDRFPLLFVCAWFIRNLNKKQFVHLRFNGVTIWNGGWRCYVQQQIAFDWKENQSTTIEEKHVIQMEIRKRSKDMNLVKNEFYQFQTIKCKTILYYLFWMNFMIGRIRTILKKTNSCRY